MQNHYFDITHQLRPYTHSAYAAPDTIAPVNALRQALPEAKKGYHWGESEGDWIYIEDHRGKEGYLYGQPHTISDFGPYPEGWSTTPPEPTEEEAKGKRRSEILARLMQIDTDSVRPLRAIANGEEDEEDRNKLTALDAEAALLREELGIL